MRGADPLLPFLVVLSFAVVLVLSVGLIIILSRRQTKRAVSPMSLDAAQDPLVRTAQALGAKDGPQPGSFELDHEHTQWRVMLTQPSKQPPMFTIAASISPALNRDLSRHGQPPYHARHSPAPPTIPFSAPIILRAETRMDRLGKRLGINRELQTGDARFDKAVYVESDAPDQLIALTLQSDQLREQVLSLFARGFTRVTLFDTDHLIKLTQQPAQKEDISAAQVSALLRSAEAILAQLPHVYLKDHALPKPSGFALGWIVLLLLSMLSIFGIGLSQNTYTPLDNTLLLNTLSVSAVSWFALLFVLIFALRGRSDSFRSWLAWVFVLSFALPVNLYLGTRTLNAIADTTPPLYKQATIDGTWRSGKNNHQCNIAFKTLPEQRRFTLSIPCDRYYGAANGQRVMLAIGPGLFGQPWLKDWRAAP